MYDLNILLESIIKEFFSNISLKNSTQIHFDEEKHHL